MTPKMFKPEEFSQSDEEYKVPGYADKENMW